jgi:hypothetical protein
VLTPPAVDRLVAKCLNKDPDERWQSAHDVADELRWLAKGAPGQTAASIGPAAAKHGQHAPVLWIRAMDSFDALPIAGTEDAGYPFWSPDSRHVAFFAGDRLQRVASPAERRKSWPMSRIAPEVGKRHRVRA